MGAGLLTTFHKPCQCILSKVETEAVTIAVRIAEFAFNISQNVIMNVNLTVAVATKNALYGIFLKMVVEIVLKKCKMTSLVTVEHIDPVVQCIPLCDCF